MDQLNAHFVHFYNLVLITHFTFSLSFILLTLSCQGSVEDWRQNNMGNTIETHIKNQSIRIKVYLIFKKL